MADVKISDLSTVTLDGLALLEVEQAGASGKVTAQDIADLATGGQLAGINDQTGTAYTFVLADAGKLVNGNNAAAQLFTVPTNAAVAFPVGAFILFGQSGTGSVTVQGDTGVTIEGNSGYTTAGRYDQRAIVQLAADVWSVL